MMFGYDKNQQDDELDIITLMIRSCVQVFRILLVSIKLKRQVEEIKAIKEIDLEELEAKMEEMKEEKTGACESAHEESIPYGKEINGGLETELKEVFDDSLIMI